MFKRLFSFIGKAFEALDRLMIESGQELHRSRKRNGRKTAAGFMLR